MFQSLFNRGSGDTFQTIDGPQAVALHADNAVFVDVRNPDEIARSGTVKGAICIPLAGLVNFAKPDGSGTLPAAADGKSIVVVCASGNRSSAACGMLSELGYGNVHNLRGGFSAYAQAGGVVER